MSAPSPSWAFRNNTCSTVNARAGNRAPASPERLWQVRNRSLTAPQLALYG